MTTSNQYSTTITVSPLPPGKVTTIPNSIATTKALSTSNTYSISPSTVTTAGSCAYGYLSGSNCVCKENFHGSKCDLISNEVRPGEGPVVVKVKVTIVVVNVKYSSELSDKKSSEYIDFEKRFKEEMCKLYSDVVVCIDIRIISVKQGSVVVEHEVLTNVSLTNGNEQYYKAVRDINNTLSRTNSTPGETGFLEFDVSRTQVQESKLDFAGLCSEVDFIPEDMRQYFYGVNESNRLLCVSNCSSFNPEFVNCNEGQCSISKTGPHCYCKTSGEFWYTGDRCENSVSKAGVIAGVTIGLAVLLLIFIVVVVKLIRRRGKTGKETLVDNEHHWYNAWEGENFEKGQNRNSASNSNNGSQSSNSGNREFRPALHKVNTDVKIRTGRAKVTH
ncbi:mucin-3B-like [Xenopus laevis]|uniref:Mucin-3B-like n=1 Tax=Xenopus laevis TaxID=8355 RepID=A0A8J1MN96_XENLA|nr:mucin-3B-like [Xenopus laevis]